MNFVSLPEMSFSAKYRINTNAPPNSFVARQIGAEEPKPASQPQKKMKWGEPTWFLFHTLAEKVKPEYFGMLRQEIFQLIQQICGNLPCPICATHAKQYLAATNFAAIMTKEHLQSFFHRFHNEVNKRKGYAIFPMEELQPKYGKANTVNIINNFIMFFEDKSPKSQRMLSDTLYRQRIVSVLKLWFNKNIQYFEL